MKGYKGFDKDLQCRGFQYKVGETFEEKEAKLCSKGLHFCENPFDVFGYYNPNTGRFCEVEAEKVSPETEYDSKRVAKKLHIKAEIGLSGIIQAGVKFILDKVKWDDKNTATGNYSGASATGDKSGASATGNYSGASATGDYSGASATGYKSGASATGDYSGASATGDKSGASATGDKSGASATGDYSGASATGDKSGASATGYKSGASATGDYSGASATGYKSGASATGNCSGASATGYKSGASAGKGSVALATGMLSRARGDLGAFIVLTECEEIRGEYFIKDVKCAKVDGENIKANTWYFLENGKFVEADERDY
ncbi:hypothetical protein IX297_001957 [Bacteroides pyogenes]|uniref:DUF7666 domain-containing protein n=1 Tax=Bacteroides pyogenes TaxID=310300 RepID=UPI001BA78315|nr:hypothetical protein [Bacteroides pyogenes]MBR8796008.1 hypothetical protein [Bacteroides pyogenes]